MFPFFAKKSRLVFGRRGLVILALASSCAGLENASAGDSAAEISILNRAAPGTDRPYGEINSSILAEEVVEPTLLPLPASWVAAGLGLLGAYALRRRSIRP